MPLQEEVDKCDSLKLAVLSNLAAVCIALGEHAHAVAFCDKALQQDPDSAKIVFRWVYVCL